MRIRTLQVGQQARLPCSGNAQVVVAVAVPAIQAESLYEGSRVLVVGRRAEVQEVWLPHAMAREDGGDLLRRSRIEAPFVDGQGRDRDTLGANAQPLDGILLAGR